jgi:hypothetical protein
MAASRFLGAQSGEAKSRSYNAPASGSLLMCAYNRFEPGKGFQPGKRRVRNLSLDPMLWTDFNFTPGHSLLFLYSPNRKLLFVSYADSTESSARFYLAILDFTTAAPPRVIEYPGPRTGFLRDPELVLSADGRWLYTVCHHIHPCQMSPGSFAPEVTVVTDLDCSQAEDFVYTFDVNSLRFVPSTVGFLKSNSETLTLVPTSGEREFNIYYGEGIVQRCLVAEDGKLIQKAGSVSPVLHSSALVSQASYSVRGAPDQPVYLVQPERVLLLSGEEPKAFAIDPPQPGDMKNNRTFLSGDWRLMFIVTMRLDPPKNVLAWRIATYRTDTFAKVRELEITPPVAVAANRDGSLLYCAENGCSNCITKVSGLQVRDSQTLRVVKDLVLGEEMFSNYYVVP